MPATASNLLTRRAAAEALGMSVSTLRRDEARGAPVARPGGKGQGHATLYDLEALRRWYERPAPAAPVASDGLRELLVELPELLAGITEDVFKSVDGKHKIALADALSALSLRLIWALRDKFGDGLELPPLTAETLPGFLTYLRELAKLLEGQKGNCSKP